MRAYLPLAALLIAAPMAASLAASLGAPAAAQPAPAAAAAPAAPTANENDADGVPLTPLPAPDLDENAKPSAFLQAAENALAAGRNGEAENALEMAQTRMLDRSVPLFKTDAPSGDPIIATIAQARAALAANDRDHCMQLIGEALKTAQARGL